MRLSLSTSLRALTHMTPNDGLPCSAADVVVADMAARVSSRLSDHFSTCGWKTWNVTSPAVNVRGHWSSAAASSAGAVLAVVVAGDVLGVVASGAAGACGARG